MNWGFILCIIHPSWGLEESFDWPMARGTQSLTGVASGKLPEEPSLLWQFKTEQAIDGAPAIVDGIVYMGSDDEHVYAISLETGKLVWEATLEGQIDATPCVLGDSLYVGSSGGTFYCLATENGAPRWTFETGDKILGGANYYEPDNLEYPWIIFGSYDSYLYCLDSRDGSKVWTYQTDNFINGTPAVFEDQVIVGGCDAHVHVLSATDGSAICSVEVGGPIAGSVAVDGGFAYVGHYGNEVVCVDIADQTVEWTFKDRAFPYASSPALSLDRVVIGGRDKGLHCLDRKTGERIWRASARENIDSSPVICGDRVVYGTEDGTLNIVSLEKVSQENGDEGRIWSFTIGEALIAPPAVARGMIVIGSYEGTVYAFGATPPSLEDDRKEPTRADQMYRTVLLSQKCSHTAFCIAVLLSVLLYVEMIFFCGRSRWLILACSLQALAVIPFVSVVSDSEATWSKILAVIIPAVGFQILLVRQLAWERNRPPSPNEADE